jgi:hypothetical protein
MSTIPVNFSLTLTQPFHKSTFGKTELLLNQLMSEFVAMTPRLHNKIIRCYSPIKQLHYPTHTLPVRLQNQPDSPGILKKIPDFESGIHLGIKSNP